MLVYIQWDTYKEPEMSCTDETISSVVAWTTDDEHRPLIPFQTHSWVGLSYPQTTYQENICKHVKAGASSMYKCITLNIQGKQKTLIKGKT